MGTSPSTKIQMNLVARCMVEVKGKEGFRLIHVWRAKVGLKLCKIHFMQAEYTKNNLTQILRV
jgi:Lon protease-like protein